MTLVAAAVKRPLVQSKYGCQMRPRDTPQTPGYAAIQNFKRPCVSVSIRAEQLSSELHSSSLRSMKTASRTPFECC
jgi:hypothetical protein